MDSAPQFSFSFWQVEALPVLAFQELGVGANPTDSKKARSSLLILIPSDKYYIPYYLSMIIINLSFLHPLKDLLLVLSK